MNKLNYNSIFTKEKRLKLNTFSTALKLISPITPF